MRRSSWSASRGWKEASPEAKRANRMLEKEIDAEAEDLRKQLDAAVEEALTANSRPSPVVCGSGCRSS
jgi:hypothetical protein